VFCYQRITRGWADRDVWGIHSHLSKIIPEMVQRLRDVGHGLPTWTEKKTDEQAQKEWLDILNSIILTFKVAQRIEQNFWYYQESKKYSIKKAKKWEKVSEKIRARSPELWGQYD